MPANGVCRNGRVAFVDDPGAIDQRKSAESHHGLIKAISRKLRDQWFAELSPRLGEQKQRDRLGCEQRCIGNQRCRGRLQFGSLIDRSENVSPRRRSGTRPARQFAIEHPCRCGFETLRIFRERDLEPLAVSAACSCASGRPPSISDKTLAASCSFSRPVRVKRYAAPISDGHNLISTGDATPRHAGAFDVTSTRAAPPRGRKAFNAPASIALS